MAANIREAYQNELKGTYQSIKQAVEAADLINGYHMDPEMKRRRTADSVKHNLGMAISGIAVEASHLKSIIRKFDNLGSFEAELVEMNYQGWTKEELEQYYRMLVYKAPSDLEERMPPEMHGVWQQVCQKAFGNYRIEASSVAKLYKQAYYILKKAEDKEVDSTMITLSLRPVVNNVIETFKGKGGKVLADAITDAVMAGATAASKAGKEVSGTAVIGGKNLTTNAIKQGNAWIVQNTTTLPYSGDLWDNQYTKGPLTAVLQEWNAVVIKAIQVELNRNAANIDGNKITGHIVEVNSKSASV